jgi:hypothetical protein
LREINYQFSDSLVEILSAFALDLFTSDLIEVVAGQNNGSFIIDGIARSDFVLRYHAFRFLIVLWSLKQGIA